MFRAKLRTLVCKPPVNCSVTHKPLDNKNNGTCYDCYQFVIKRLIEIAETRINTGFFKQLDLFKLVFVEWLCGTYWNTAYGNPSVVGFIKMTGDKCVDYPCAQKASYAYMVITIIAMLASVPLWQAIGLC